MSAADPTQILRPFHIASCCKFERKKYEHGEFLSTATLFSVCSPDAETLHSVETENRCVFYKKTK